MSVRSKFQDFVHPEWKPSRGDAAIALGSMIGVPVTLGALMGAWTQKDVKSWYRSIKKPSWTPPSWVFGPVWTVLYILLGFASWSVWTHGGTEKQKIPLGFYAATLILNLTWTPVFFEAKKLDLALINVLAQFGLLTSTIVAFHKVEPLAALVLVPVWLVTGFAAFLTSAIFTANPQKARRSFNGLFKAFDRLAQHGE